MAHGSRSPRLPRRRTRSRRRARPSRARPHGCTVCPKRRVVVPNGRRALRVRRRFRPSPSCSRRDGSGTTARISRPSTAPPRASPFRFSPRVPCAGRTGPPSRRAPSRRSAASTMAHVARHLARQPIFVSTALYEPFGLAVLEAAQAGCALVLSDIPTFRELWDGAARFVPARDDGALACAIERTRRTTRRPAGASAMPPGGAPRTYTVEAMSLAYAALYGSLIRSHPCPPDRGCAHEVCVFHPFAGLLLEPRQRAFPAGVLRELIHRGHTREGLRAEGAWSLENLLRIMARRGSTPIAAIIPNCPRSLRPDGRSGGARRRCRCGDRARVERALARRRHRPPAAPGRPLHAPVPRHPPPRRERSGRDPAVRSRRL